MSSTRVTFDLSRGVITLEGSAADLGKLFEAVQGAAPSFKEIRIVNAAVSRESADVDTPPASGEPTVRPSTRSPAMRDFARRFSLDNTYERIALLAYHARTYGARPTFSAKEMGDWFGLCGFKKPLQMPVALNDARRRYGYVENRGRDQWSLATGGENRVLEIIDEEDKREA